MAFATLYNAITACSSHSSTPELFMPPPPSSPVPYQNSMPSLSQQKQQTILFLLLSHIIVSYYQLNLLEPCSGQWPKFEEASLGWWSICSGQLSVDDVVSSLFWLATLTRCIVRQSPRLHGCSVPTDPSSQSLFSRPMFPTQIFSLDAFSWVRYVAMNPGGSGCFPLLLPRFPNPASFGQSWG